LLMRLLDAIVSGSAAGIFKADHLVHLRCEVGDEATPAFLATALAQGSVAVASVMDHTPGGRQTHDLEGHIRRRAEALGRSVADERADIEAIQAKLEGVAERVRPQVVAQLQSGAMPLMSHDDATARDVDQARDEGIAICEFPTTMEAGRAARAAGMTVVAGAPNYVRGGSQSGNVAVADLLRAGLVDILASDYVPRSILDAVFALGEDDTIAIDLPAAVKMATLSPARAVGLADRGAIAVGQRADLVRVGMAGKPFVKSVWRAGNRVT
ncbi:MAG: alpha-D-ribose 1-methylphosphonate 5-triphosphate diphosphatase, partial [Pseudomonadota bacterium]